MQMASSPWHPQVQSLGCNVEAIYRQRDCWSCPSSWEACQSFRLYFLTQSDALCDFPAIVFICRNVTSYSFHSVCPFLSFASVWCWNCLHFTPICGPLAETPLRLFVSHSMVRLSLLRTRTILCSRLCRASRARLSARSHGWKLGLFTVEPESDSTGAIPLLHCIRLRRWMPLVVSCESMCRFIQPSCAVLSLGLVAVGESHSFALIVWQILFLHFCRLSWITINGSFHLCGLRCTLTMEFPCHLLCRLCKCI